MSKLLLKLTLLFITFKIYYKACKKPILGTLVEYQSNKIQLSGYKIVFQSGSYQLCPIKDSLIPGEVYCGCRSIKINSTKEYEEFHDAKWYVIKESNVELKKDIFKYDNKEFSSTMLDEEIKYILTKRGVDSTIFDKLHKLAKVLSFYFGLKYRDPFIKYSLGVFSQQYFNSLSQYVYSVLRYRFIVYLLHNICYDKMIINEAEQHGIVEDFLQQEFKTYFVNYDPTFKDPVVIIFNYLRLFKEAQTIDLSIFNKFPALDKIPQIFHPMLSYKNPYIGLLNDPMLFLEGKQTLTNKVYNFVYNKGFDEKYFDKYLRAYKHAKYRVDCGYTPTNKLEKWIGDEL